MNETVLVLGASGDIGSAVCRLLHERGAKIVACGRNEQRLLALQRELDLSYLQIEDASKADEVDRVFKEAADILGGSLSGVVNCVGSVLLKPAHLTSPDEWMQVLNTNLSTAFFTVKYGVPLLRKTKGSLVLVGTAASTIGLPNHDAIAAAKAGINGLVLSAAATYGPKGVRINAVLPGLVETQLTAGITNSSSAKEFSLKMHPLGRLGNTKDIASAIAWFLHPENSWVTAQTLAVDGGLASLKSG